MAEQATGDHPIPVTALLALVLLAASAPTPDISGTWQGAMNVPGIGKLPHDHVRYE